MLPPEKLPGAQDNFTIASRTFRGELEGLPVRSPLQLSAANSWARPCFCAKHTCSAGRLPGQFEDKFTIFSATLKSEFEG
eukprot:3828957-Amphidinium_carterae.1